MKHVYVLLIYVCFWVDTAISATFVSTTKPISIHNKCTRKRTSFSRTTELEGITSIKSLHSKIEEIDAAEQILRSIIEEVNDEELGLKRELMKLNKMHSLNDYIMELDDLESSLISEIKTLDNEQIELEIESQTLRSQAVSKQQIPDSKLSITTMSLIGGGFSAVAGFRSALMNREKIQSPMSEDESSHPMQFLKRARVVLRENTSDNFSSFNFMRHVESQAQIIVSALSTNYQQGSDTTMTKIGIACHNLQKQMQKLMSSVETELFISNVRKSNSQNIFINYNQAVKKDEKSDVESNSKRKLVTSSLDKSQSMITKVETAKNKSSNDRAQAPTNTTTAITSTLRNEFVYTKDSNSLILPNQNSDSPIIMNLGGLQTETNDNLLSSLSFRAIGLGACGQNVISRISSDSLDKRNNFVSVLFGDNKKHAPRVAINAQGRFLDALVSDVKFCVIVCEAADYKSAESAKLLTKRAKSSGTLTFCVVNTPFYFEGPERLKRARKTIASLQALADTVIDVPSDAFLEMIPKNSSMTDAYSMIDTVIGRTVTNILELASKRGLAEEKIDALLVLGNDLNYPSETLEMKNSWTSLTGLNKLLTNTMIKKMQSKQDYASEDKLINSEDTEYRNNQSSDSTKTNPDTKQQPNHSSNLLHKLRAFGVGDIGCNAIVKLHPSAFNATEIFGVHFDLSVLTPLKMREAYNTFLIPIDDNSDKITNKRKMMKAIDRSGDELSTLVDDAKLCIITCEAADFFSSQAAINLVQKAKEKGALTICLVNLPFSFEGSKRKKRSEKTIGVLKEIADTVIVIPSDPILQLLPDDTSIEKAYAMIDEIVGKGVAGIIGLVGKQGLINANFKDIETIKKGAGIGSMGLGSGSGKKAAKEAAFAAVSSPLLREAMGSVKSIVLSVSGGKNMSLSDVRSVVNILYKCVDESTDVVVSAFVDEQLDDEISVTLFAMGDESSERCSVVEEAPTVSHQPNDHDLKNLKASKIVDNHDLSVSNQELPKSENNHATKLRPMRADEILSLDRHAEYSSALIYPYQSMESKLKQKRTDTESSPKVVANSLFEAHEALQPNQRSLNQSKVIADSLFQPRTHHSKNSGLFSERTKARSTTRINVLQFSILETSSSLGITNSNTHHVGLFGKSKTHHKNYLRLAIKKRKSLTYVNLLLQVLDKTIQQFSKI